MTNDKGSETNARPQTQGPRHGCQEHQQLVHQGSKDQGDLPRAELLQLGRDPEVPHCRVLGAQGRHGASPAGP
jgi:hypothetical protein